MTLLNFVTPLRISVGEQGADLARAVYGKFLGSALAETKPRRSFEVVAFLRPDDLATSTYELPSPIILDVLDSYIASIQGGVGLGHTTPLPYV